MRRNFQVNGLHSDKALESRLSAAPKVQYQVCLVESLR